MQLTLESYSKKEVIHSRHLEGSSLFRLVKNGICMGVVELNVAALTSAGLTTENAADLVRAKADELQGEAMAAADEAKGAEQAAGHVQAAVSTGIVE